MVSTAGLRLLSFFFPCPFSLCHPSNPSTFQVSFPSINDGGQAWPATMPLGSPITRAAAVSKPLRAVQQNITMLEMTLTRRRLQDTTNTNQLLAKTLAIGLNVSGLKNGPG